jgi:poly(3-hydroxybutyrate) depolymerase
LACPARGSAIPYNTEAIAARWWDVHQVDKARQTLKAGSSNDAGEAVIEVNMIVGMGHGSPVGGDLVAQ